MSALVAARAGAEPQVVVFGTESGPPPAGFVQALAIQCAGSAKIEADGSLSGSVSQKLDAVAEPLQKEGASVGLWVERTGNASSAEFLVYVASKSEGRVLVQVVRLPGRDEPETDRALALKVREVLDTVLHAQGGVASGVAPPESTPSQPESRVHGFVWQPVVFGGFALATAGNGRSATEGGITAGAGVRFGDGRFLGELTLEVRPFLPAKTHSAGAEAETRELDVMGRVHTLIESDALAAGIQWGGGANVVSASGTAADGRTGDATRVVPFIEVGPEVRLLFSRYVSLRLEAGLDLNLRRQRFSVVGQQLSDLGTIRGSGDVSVLVAF